MATQYSPDGRITWNLTLDDECDKLRLSKYTMDDMEPLYELTAHVDPTYTLSSTLQTKAVNGTYISYRVTVTCTNGHDTGVPLTISINMPAGFTYITSWSEEGSYNSGSADWTCTLNKDDKAILVFLVNPTGNGSQTQTTSIDGTTYTLNSACDISPVDSWSIYSATATLDDFFTLSHMRDGQVYTFLAYSRVDDPGIVGIYDGIKNNRIAVQNGFNEIVGGRVASEGGYELVSVTFQYDEDYPVNIKLYGQYQSVSEQATDLWAGFRLRESTGIDVLSQHNFKIVRTGGTLGFGYMILIPTELDTETPNADAVNAARDVRVNYEVV